MKHAQTRRIPLVLLAALVALALPAAAFAESYELRGKEVAIWNIAGEVEIVRGSGNAVSVDITRGGGDADELEVVTGQIEGKQTLRVIYPGKRISYGRSGWWGIGSSTTLRVGRDGRFSDGSTRDGRGEKVRIGSGGGLDAYADMRITVPRGQDIAVYLAVGEANATDIEGDLMIDVAAADVTARGTNGKVVIDVGSGTVEVHDTNGDVDIDTGSGDVELSNVKGESVIIDTGSGGVAGSRIVADRVEVDTGSGRVDLGSVAASVVTVDTGSGGVNLDLTGDVERINIDTGSGGVNVRVPRDLGAEVYIETGSGGIRSDVPIEIQRKDRDSLRGRIGDGKGRIVIETGSGSVRLLEG